MKYNAIVGQSGGPTAAINATLAGVIYGALESECIDKLYGAINGVEGILRGQFIDLTEKFADNISELELLSHTPAAALGSCRMKLPKTNGEKHFETYVKLFDFFKANNIRYFFYIGGNDSMDTVAKLSEMSPKFDWEMQFIGVPKTIDNDLCGTDHTPGFGSAAKYIAATMQDILYDCAVYTVKSVTLVEIMGRDSGWLTAAAAIPALNGFAPDYIYLPEVAFNEEAFIEDIKKAHEKHPNVVIVVSEGIRFADGRYVGESIQNGVTDVFGHKYLAGTVKYLESVIKQKIGCKVRAFDLNLPQRCASYMLSATDVNESISVGKFAVKSAEHGVSKVMVSYERTDNPYKISYVCKDVSLIANQIKVVPSEYINNCGNQVTEECLNYLLPLIQGQVELKYDNGIPRHILLKDPNKYHN